jgi:hypothetical protein
MLIIVLDYTCNIVIHIYIEYLFVNSNLSNYTFYNTQNTPLYIHWVTTKLVIFATNGI